MIQNQLMLDHFTKAPEVLRIFKDLAISSVEVGTEILELYKFNTRSSIIKVLEDFSPDSVLDIQSFTHDEKFAYVEDKFDVLVRQTDDGCVEVIYNFFNEINKNAIELALDEYHVTFVCITSFNWNGLKDPSFSFVQYNRTILFKRILIEAIRLGATDIHFCVEHRELGKACYPVKFRINGAIQECKLFKLTREMNESLISSLIEKETNANSLDLITPDGVTAMANNPLGNDSVELRIAANKVFAGYQCVIRIQKKETFSFKIDSLGFPLDAQKALMRMTEKKSGIVFITGAIRTGKNTTAFALANEMINKPIKIVSYEYPIEVLMPFTQVNYEGDINALLNAVRLAKKQDVNVAFINELPNKEVAFAVQDLVNSSVYVITTMHVDRLWHLPYKLREYYGDEYKNVISQINGVFNQKMYQIACPGCRKRTLVDHLDDRLFKFLSERGVQSVTINDGCEMCNNTGVVLGKDQPLVEFVEFDDELKEKLLECDAPYQMEAILKQKVRQTGNSLETALTNVVESGDFNADTLLSIL